MTTMSPAQIWIEMMVSDEEVQSIIDASESEEEFLDMLASAVDLDLATEDVVDTFVETVLAEVNPHHDPRDGTFTSKPAHNRIGKGSWSLSSTTGTRFAKFKKRHKSKVKNGNKTGNPTYAKTPTLCGRDARAAGLDVLCWTGRPPGDGEGRARPEHTRRKRGSSLR